jgi:hypothetical protein
LLDENIPVKSSEALSEDEWEFMSDLNKRIMAHEASRSQWTAKGHQLMSGTDSNVNYKFDTYKERCELFEGKGAIRYSPYPGMEVALFHSTVSEIANCFMTRDSLFNGMTAEPIVRRQLMTAPLMGTGTIDLIGALDSSQEDIPPILFAHKPDLSFRDMICFQVALRRDLRLEYREGKIVFEGTHAKLISAPMRGYIAQVSHGPSQISVLWSLAHVLIDYRASNSSISTEHVESFWGDGKHISCSS